MARRARTTNKSDSKPESTTTEATEEASVTTATEEMVEAAEDTAAETPVEATESTETPATDEIDLSDFKAAAERAVEERDSATGELPTAAIEPVLVEYRKLEGIKAKNAAKRWLDASMKHSMDELNIQQARAFMQLGENMTSAPSAAGRAERAPADPTEAFVQLLAGLKLATQLAAQDVPEGVSEDWKDKANQLVQESADPARSYLEWLNADEEARGDEPEVSAFVKAAVKLSQGKSARVAARKSGGTATPYTGERRDIAKHIEAAFAEVEAGTFLTIAQIRAHKSEEYGDDQPSAGAISARLFPSNGKVNLPEGIEPARNDEGRKGARKTA